MKVASSFFFFCSVRMECPARLLKRPEAVDCIDIYNNYAYIHGMCIHIYIKQT